MPTTENMETNIPGVYAAGDLRIKELRQTAVADLVQLPPLMRNVT